MKKKCKEKIDIDILIERPLHDLLASIFVVIGICREVVLDGFQLGLNPQFRSY